MERTEFITVPCGTGTCARLTLHHVDGDLATGERVEVTGPVGSTFGGISLIPASTTASP
ncbi:MULTISPECIES: proline racemase family protein [unclassified Haloarcula]|uniref:proline racemase family protein n=1 Tax=unclassified Haloarcula TaxID=2624677 RepID=UPI001CD9371C|nr:MULTISPECIES: proline racemase family protein [unclassified Haloarcula]